MEQNTPSVNLTERNGSGDQDEVATLQLNSKNSRSTTMMVIFFLFCCKLYIINFLFKFPN